MEGKQSISRNSLIILSPRFGPGTPSEQARERPKPRNSIAEALKKGNLPAPRSPLTHPHQDTRLKTHHSPERRTHSARML